MTSVFISWGSPDLSAANELARRLKSVGLDVFFSTMDMHAGEDPADRVHREIRAARVAIIALSNESLKRDWVVKEINWCDYELRNNASLTRCIPVVVGDLDEHEIPDALKPRHRRSLTDPATREKVLKQLAEEIVVDVFGNKLPITVQGALFALNQAEFEQLVEQDDHEIDALLRLCGATVAGDRRHYLKTFFGGPYVEQRDDFTPFRGEPPVKSLVEDAVTQLNVKRRAMNEAPVWLQWDTAQLLDKARRREDWLVEFRRANSCLTIVDALSAFSEPIRDALLHMPVSDDLRRRGIIWISPLFKDSPGIESLISQIAQPVNQLQEAFADWRNIADRSVAFHTGTVISFRQWLWRAVGDLASEPGPLEKNLAAVEAAHQVTVRTSAFFGGGRRS